MIDLTRGSLYANAGPDISLLPRLYGASDINKFIPLYAPFNFSKSVIVNSSVLLYGLPVIAIGYPYRQVFNYRDLLRILKSGIYPTLFSTKSISNILINRGCLYDIDENRVLVCIGVDSSKYTTIDKDKPDYNQFVCFIDNKFVTDDKYKYLNNKLQKVYFPFFRENGIDIIQTNSINKWMFNSGLKELTFNTLNERKEHLASISKYIEYD